MNVYLIGHEHPAWPAGLTARQRDHWTRRGYLRASNADCGTGHVRTWPRREADVAALMLRLVAAGMVPRAASRVARAALAGTSEEPVGVEIAPGVVIVVGAPDREPVATRC